MAASDVGAHISETIMSSVGSRWLKVAMIVARVEKELERRRIVIPLDVIGAQIAALVQSGRLEGAGNLINWRHSEVRLPPNAQ